MELRLLLAVCLIGLPRPADAALQFTQTTINLGDLKAGVPLTQSFSFINPGSDPVEITEIRPGCGCLKPRLTKRVIAPGEKGALVLDIRSLGQPAGAHEWTVAVVTRAGQELQETTLRLRANVVTEVIVQPAALTLYADGPLTQVVTVTDRRPRAMHISHLQTSSARLRAALTGPTQDEQKLWRYTIKLELAGDYPEGQHFETLTIHTEDTDYGVLSVPLTLVKRARPRLGVTPEELIFDDPGQRVLRVRDREGAPIEIERVTSEATALSFQVTPGPDGQATIRVQLDRTRLAGRPLEGTIRIETRRPAGQVLTVPVRSDF